ncbi:MAG: dihydropyrimidinase, partial [Acidobacteriota bacterium]|nr:dihydropyrimidinase [Acidobacteriota bacterium]
IVIFYTEKSQTISADTHHMNVDYSAYEGYTVQGVVDTLLSRGRVVIDEGEYIGEQGDGQFIKRGECVKI